MAEQVSARQSAQSAEPVSGWAVGFALFAGIMMVTIGIFQVIEGLAAIIKNEFYVVARNYTFELDVTAWGWIHLLVGILVGLAGFFVFTGQPWARAVGITFAVLNAISQFFFLPYYPVWAILMIAMDVAVIWALCVYGRGSARNVGAGSY